MLPKVCSWIRKEYEKYFGAHYMVKRGIDESYLEAPFAELINLYKRYLTFNFYDHVHEVNSIHF